MRRCKRYAAAKPFELATRSEAARLALNFLPCEGLATYWRNALSMVFTQIVAVVMQSLVLSQNSSGREIDMGVKIAHWPAIS
jgi:hypothetical protein